MSLGPFRCLHRSVVLRSRSGIKVIGEHPVEHDLDGTDVAYGALRPRHAALVSRAASTKTDTAAELELGAVSHALQVAHDSLATVPELRAQIDSVAVADSVLRINVLHMQTAYATTLALKDSALVAKDSALASGARALVASKEDVAAQDRIIASLKSAQPSVVRRGFRGVEAAVAGIACGALGTLASPVIGIAAGVACAGVAGATLP